MAAEVLQYVEVAVAAAYAEVVGVVAVPAVEEVLHLDGVVAEHEAERVRAFLGPAFDVDAHARA